MDSHACNILVLLRAFEHIHRAFVYLEPNSFLMQHNRIPAMLNI